MAVTGIVFDRLTMRGRRDGAARHGRRSAVEPQCHEWRQGHFEFIDVPVGSSHLGFFHPTLDSLGLTSETKRLDLRVEQPSW